MPIIREKREGHRLKAIGKVGQQAFSDIWRGIRDRPVGYSHHRVGSCYPGSHPRAASYAGSERLLSQEYSPTRKEAQNQSWCSSKVSSGARRGYSGAGEIPLASRGGVQGVEFEENNSREAERGGKAPAQPPQENDASSTVVAKTCSGASIELYAGEKQMLDLHNRTRSERGLPLLCINPILTKTARDHSQDMLDRDYFSHYSPEGSTPFDRMKRVGYTSCGRTSICGENLAVGASYPSTPERLFEALMNSPGHRANILRKEFREVGIGLQAGNYKKYDETASMYSIEFAGQP
jgi:uncharacterized protein YkwD